MIRARNCLAPPQNWGPGVHILPCPLHHPNAFGTGDLTFIGGMYVPHDYYVYGWYYAVSTLAGGSSPNVDFAIRFGKANIASGGYSADVSVTGIVADAAEYVDLSNAPVLAGILSAGARCAAGRAIIHVGGVALTALPGLALGLICKPIDSNAFPVT